ncbi:hypothetical protein NGA_0419200 [Nannochloropsis gaditana CCMP526]|uniref:uncharacterized protein n=1 Tax=Nannochloropsis gaditana (strain CCMP526) TaxID=1093141 RepID=UPI00029F765B|nr:hypothetical protein NGA_0419200 [Nannochloropsis gaditana CCMP526]EKU21507.1 hypothetical protein NGA_0419200 [Nannochloropsis gaditana CCMP526]|eukprot:XP_005854853.1 hypothetical protein NGA_0419200 [Nannochloropsis gaditana CCMP526]
MPQKQQEQRKEHDQHLDHPAADTGEPKSTAEDHSVQIYFFSGNPYVYALYDNLLSLLRIRGHAKGRRISTLLVTYPSLPDFFLADPQAAFAYIAKDVHQQIWAHERARHSPSPTHTLLVGHSFGAYIANLLLPHLTPVPIASIYLFPFLSEPSWRGKLQLALADQAYRRTPFLGSAVHGVTSCLFDWVLRFISSPFKRQSLGGGIDPETLRAILRVAACERAEIGGKGPDLSHVDMHGERHGSMPYLVYTEGDEWSPRYVWDAWPEERRVDMSHVPHAFPCHEAHDEEVCETVLQIVGKVVGGHEGKEALTDTRARL